MPSRTINKLTDMTIRKAKAPGWYGDGAGLYLRIDADGGKRWIFVFQWQKKRAEMGLGPLADKSLADARDDRDAARKLVGAGKNPIDERRAERAAAAAAVAPMTFSQWAEEAAPAIGPKAAKARKAWVSMMQVKVGILAQMAPDEIQTEHVLAAIKPYWQSRPESGKRMRQRIERVLDAAKSKGLIQDPWNNPARLRGHLENLLPKRSTAVNHHKALPYAEAPAFMARVRAIDTVSARALEFTLLTVARTKETLGASLPEIDVKEKVWVVPARRMKGPEDKRREHRVPLCARALQIVEEMRPLAEASKDGYLFPSIYAPGKKSKSGRLSEAAMQRVMDDLDMKGIATVHGIRSTFKDWAEDTTNFANGVIEAALAHAVGDETERAYRRSDAILKRRKLMDAWAGYLHGRAGNVIPISGVAS